MTEREQKVKTVMDAETQLKFAVEALPQDLRKTVNDGRIEEVLDEELSEVTAVYARMFERQNRGTGATAG